MSFPRRPNIYLALLLIALGLTLAVFGLWPQIDLRVAAYFHGGDGFIGASAPAKFARDVFRVTPYLLLILLLALSLLKRLRVPLPWAPDGRAALFLALTMAVGPGLVVNAAMKEHLHRPRPVHVTEFGGPDAFKPWYEFDGACKANCSFASGEAAQAFWMVAPALLVPSPWQALALTGAFAFGVATSVLRMAFGGHFPSDVLVGGLLSLIVIELARRLIWRRSRGEGPP